VRKKPLGLALIVFSVALWHPGPDWGELGQQLATVDKPGDEKWITMAFYAVALFGAAMTPYEVFFFSSGGVEEKWTEEDISVMRANVLIGFPLGGLLSPSIAGACWVALGPYEISGDSLGQVGLPVAVALGKVGLAIAVVGFWPPPRSYPSIDLGRPQTLQTMSPSTSMTCRSSRLSTASNSPSCRFMVPPDVRSAATESLHRCSASILGARVCSVAVGTATVRNEKERT
jgi:hypothetical protein